jgi:hypothetical protein
MRPLGSILTDIDAFIPNPNADWLRLDALLAEVFERSEDLTPAIETLLRVFERFPRHDGHGVLFGVIHGLEQVSGYERALIASVQRCPTELSVTMLRRLLKSGVARVGDVDVAALIAWGLEHAPKVDGTL